MAARVRALGRRAATVRCDVRRRSLVDAAMAEAVEAMGGGPDILVASAGGWTGGAEGEAGAWGDMLWGGVRVGSAC